MSNDNKIESYLYDTIALLKIQTKEAKQGMKDYNIGYLMAYHTVISLLKNKAMAFNIDEESIGLSDIEPERDLL